jgi:hypothetical protein
MKISCYDILAQKLRTNKSLAYSLKNKHNKVLYGIKQIFFYTSCIWCIFVVESCVTIMHFLCVCACMRARANSTQNSIFSSSLPLKITITYKYDKHNFVEWCRCILLDIRWYDLENNSDGIPFVWILFTSMQTVNKILPTLYLEATPFWMDV